MQVKPSFSSDNAYCTVSMFKAALDILYAGTGMNPYFAAVVIEPSVEELNSLSASHAVVTSVAGEWYTCCRFSSAIPFAGKGGRQQ